MSEGYFDLVAGRDVCGWIWDPANPQLPIMAHVFINGREVCSGLANHYRPDLQAAGIGNGEHAFYVPLPDEYLNGQEVLLEVRGIDGLPIHRTPLVTTLPNLVFQPIAPPPVPHPIPLAVCGIVRDEAPYLLEWIAWHRLIGVDHFVLFDNESVDGTTAMLKSLAKAGLVDHVVWPNIKDMPAQRAAYIAGLARLGWRCRWVAFIDADEFLNPLRGETLPQILADYDTAAGLVVPWRLFGSNGHVQKDDELVINRFTRRGPAESHLNHSVKTIVQARLVARPDIHTPKLAAGSLVDEFGELAGTQGHPDRHAVPAAQRLVLNHYFTKSREEWYHKRLRGKACEVVGTDGWLRPDNHFDAHDLNDIEDLGLANRAAEVQAEIARLRQLL
ncbi:MAG: glycosyltransferase family 2 protein [Pseudomonadota bacterium]